MKTIRIATALFLSILTFQYVSAQTSSISDTIEVNGNCGTCKKNIEKSALAAGATFANWNKATKFLQINYNPATTNSSKIQLAIAAAGYDTRDFKANDSAYFKLDDCCQYDRTALKEPADKK